MQGHEFGRCVDVFGTQACENVLETVAHARHDALERSKAARELADCFAIEGRAVSVDCRRSIEDFRVVVLVVFVFDAVATHSEGHFDVVFVVLVHFLVFVVVIVVF